MIQEQHAERCRLYAQWKEFEWPILQDRMTSIGLTEVPVAVLIDEHGIVQSTRPNRKQIVELVATNSPAPSSPAPPLADKWNDPELILAGQGTDDWQVEHLILAGDAFLKRNEVFSAIDCYKKFLDAEKSTSNEKLTELIPEVQFRLGVASRVRYDSNQSKQSGDFGIAADWWTRAREGNPNQYIWRRRIEQYGPRQIKPYPFYDWIENAVADISARGETPIELTVRLSGAELALPMKQDLPATSAKNPDPSAKTELLDNGQVSFSKSLVPSRVKTGETVRVHLQFDPSKDIKWNNESTPMQVWINGSDQGTCSTQLMQVNNAKTAVSKESRVVEFDFQTKENSSDVELTGYALVNICEDESGQCLFRRFEFKIAIPQE